MNTFQSHCPTVGRFFRWFFGWRIFSWRVLRGVLFCIAALATLIAIYYTEEDWRGERDWGAYKSEMQSKGTWVDMAALASPPRTGGIRVEDDPLLSVCFPPFDGKPSVQISFPTAYFFLNKPRPWGEQGHIFDAAAFQKFYGTTDVLGILNDPKLHLDEIATAFRERGAYFYPADNKLDLGQVLTAGQSLGLRAEAELAQGMSDRAFGDVRAMFAMARTIADGQTLTAQLIAIAIVFTGKDVIWQGIAQRQWNAAQLTTLQTELQQMDYFAWLLRGFRLEESNSATRLLTVMAGGLGPPTREGKIMLQIVNTCPRGWFFQNLISNDRYFQKLIPAFDAPNHHFDLAQSQMANDYRKDMNDEWRPSTFLACFTTSNLDGIAESGAGDACYLDEAIVACALERYRLANGKLPESLDALVPQYIAKLPLGIFDGQPMKYKPGENGEYELAVGGSEVGKGDIVWKMPAVAK